MGRSAVRADTMLLWMLSPLSPALARPPTVAEVQAALTTFSSGAAHTLVDLDTTQLGALASGEVVRVIDQPGGEGAVRRATALMVTDVSRRQMWLACQDPHFQGDPSVHEVRLSLAGPDDALWYGFADLPLPLDDRHWVVRSWNNHALAHESGGRAWEHPWEGASVGLEAVEGWVSEGRLGAVTEERFSEAVFTPVNHGAFLAIELPGGGSIFGYHATFDPGGVVPDWLIARLAHAGLERGFRRYEARGRDVIPTHYRAGHAPVYGGDGVPIAP